MRSINANIFPFSNTDLQFCKTMGGGELSLLGLAKINLKIFNLSFVVWVFVINVCEHNLVLGLDLIKKFRLSQDYNLKISQSIPDQQNGSFDGAELPVQVQSKLVEIRSIVPDAFHQHLQDPSDGNAAVECNIVKISDNNTKLLIECELCNNHMKDIEQLEKHMQWSHKIHWGEHMSHKDLLSSLKHLSKGAKSGLFYLIDEYKNIFAKNKYDVGNFSGHHARI